MSSPVEKIKERLDIVDVVASYIKLDKAGANYKARCPFHNEKTPSFFVSPTRQTYHCFGCNKGGDLVSFVQEIEGLDFLGAVKILGDRAGIEVGHFDQKEKEENDGLYRVLAEATDFWANNLADNQAGLDYLKKRGLTNETIKNFRVGFADNDWQSLSKHLLARGFSSEEIIGAGLALPSRNKNTVGVPFYDRFRSRIMFPIFDSAGRPVAFSGRIFGIESNEGKYVNSPQTKLYDKSKILYGFDRAKVAIRREGSAVLVEGQMDLILSHQAGVENAVAVSGTALSEYHLNIIKRLAPEIIMAFDRDIAGLAASKRAIDMALSTGFEVKAASLPKDEDPADLILKSPESWKETIALSSNIIDFYLSVIGDLGYDSRSLKLAVSREVLPYINRLSNALDQAHFVSKVANFLSVSEEPIWEELGKIKTPVESRGKEISRSAPSGADRERSRSKNMASDMFGLLFYLEEQSSPPLAPDFLRASLKEILEENYSIWENEFKTERDKLSFRAEVIYAGSEKVKDQVADILEQIKTELIRDKLNVLMSEIKKAESVGDHELLDRHLKECQTLTKLLNDHQK